MKWTKADVKHLPSGGDFIKAIDVGAKKLCLIRIEERVYATQLKCPHAGADLSRGFCKNGKLICPYHRYSYNLSTGKGDAGRGDYIETYPVEVRNDGIYINLPERWKFFKNLFK